MKDLIQKISQTLKIVFLALILSFGISYVFAWTGPTAIPPADNVSEPINIGTTNQTKTGGILTAYNLWANSSLGVTGGATFGGNVGIGTTTPNWTLQVASATPYIAITDTDAVTNDKHWLIANVNGIFRIGTSSDSLISTATYFTITRLGNVGIGTINPGTNRLEVSGGPIKATGGLIIETRTSSDPISPADGQIWLRTDL